MNFRAATGRSFCGAAASLRLAGQPEAPSPCARRGWCSHSATALPLGSGAKNRAKKQLSGSGSEALIGRTVVGGRAFPEKSEGAEGLCAGTALRRMENQGEAANGHHCQRRATDLLEKSTEKRGKAANKTSAPGWPSREPRALRLMLDSAFPKPACSLRRGLLPPILSRRSFGCPTRRTALQ